MIVRRVALVASLCLAGWAAPAAAVGGHDTEPPVLTTPIKARFVVGTRLAQFRDTEEGHAYFDVPMRLSWSATDNIDTALNFDVWEHPQAEAPVLVGDYITASEFDDTASDYDGFFGGAALVVDHWSVQAYDDAGNSVQRSMYGARLLVTQDDGQQTYGSPSKNVRVRYSGDWSTSRCACYADRTASRSTDRGAAVILRVVVPDREDVRRVALVMDQGPHRGRVQLVVDGEQRGKVDLGTATAIHRAIVWTTTLPAGTHLIRVVNLATPDRPRVAFDAVAVN